MFVSLLHFGLHVKFPITFATILYITFLIFTKSLVFVLYLCCFDLGFYTQLCNSMQIVVLKKESDEKRIQTMGMDEKETEPEETTKEITIQDIFAQTVDQLVLA